ncbi:MAG: (d)CMP kinase [Armatimonadota bacterium]
MAHSSNDDTIAIIGTGLIGASCALALRRVRYARRIIGVARSEATRRFAVERGIVDEAHQDPARAVAHADVVYLAMPLAATEDVICRIAPALRPNCLVTDAGSVKAPVVEAAGRLLPYPSQFVGGHPMAGKERSGIAQAEATLFRRCPYFLTPSEQTSPQALDRARSLVEALGARPVVLSAEEHDDVVAAVSHMPHVLASALVATVCEGGERVKRRLQGVGPGFLSTTRVASSPAALWREILEANRDAVLRWLRAFGERAAQWERLIAEGRWSELEVQWARAAALRASLPRLSSAARPSIAIDGPAGSGKSTVAREVARILGLTYVDTGAMYRAVAYRVIKDGIEPDDHDAVADLASRLDMQFSDRDDGPPRLIVDGEDVTDLVREPEVARLSSPVSAIPGVRRHLVALQRRMAADGGVVMEGRDIQTRVLPDADLKVFLTASDDERARRRHLELRERGVTMTLDDVKRDIAERDRRDSSREVDPLKPAPDALIIETDGLTVEQVVQRVAREAQRIRCARD